MNITVSAQTHSGKTVLKVMLMTLLLGFAALSFAQDSTKIDINQADVATLTELSGIGDSKAQAIIDEREASGDFSSIEELARVDGIGEKTIENIKAEITVQKSS